jgi:hypothetical protein
MFLKNWRGAGADSDLIVFAIGANSDFIVFASVIVFGYGFGCGFRYG